MRELNAIELSLVSGGEQEIDDSYSGGEGGGGGDMQSVEIVGTKDMVQDAKDDYAMKNNVANAVGAVFGAAAGGVVLAACDYLTEGLAARQCGILAGTAATYTGSTMADNLKSMIK